MDYVIWEMIGNWDVWIWGCLIFDDYLMKYYL